MDWASCNCHMSQNMLSILFSPLTHVKTFLAKQQTKKAQIKQTKHNKNRWQARAGHEPTHALKPPVAVSRGRATDTSLHLAGEMPILHLITSPKPGPVLLLDDNSASMPARSHPPPPPR